MLRDMRIRVLSANEAAFQRLQTAKVSKFLCITASLLTISGAKNWLISAFGIATPYRDQWDAQAAFLFTPFLDGTLSPWFFFTPHNEHRILFTRILNLGLLWANQYWDPILEMAVNGLVHVICIGVMLSFMLRALERARFLPFSLFVALLYALPLGYENTLSGFQSQFYFLILFSLLSLWLLHKSSAWHATWWLGILCAIASYFSLASGAMTMAAGALQSLAQLLLGRRHGWREVLASAAQLALLLVMLAYVPSGNAAYGAHSVGGISGSIF